MTVLRVFFDGIRRESHILSVYNFLKVIFFCVICLEALKITSLFYVIKDFRNVEMLLKKYIYVVVLVSCDTCKNSCIKSGSLFIGSPVFTVFDAFDLYRGF